LNRVFSIALALSFALTSTSGFNGTRLQGEDDPPWYKDWGLETGFSIQIDTEGYQLPTAIAFVPDPGSDPGDPLYYVTELRGSIKVVTNDRKVQVFAQNFIEGDVGQDLSRTADEYGLTGICLDPINGYIFATYSTRVDADTLVNSIIRFETKSKIFSTAPTSTLVISDPLMSFPTGPSHQIGGCQVIENMLYVGVGDGFSLYEPPLGIDNPLGKILRFTLDGDPIATNPYYSKNSEGAPRGYVYAQGFRNPYAIESVNGIIFVAENGLKIDRFSQVDLGDNFLWDGTDSSIGVKAEVVFSPAIAPTQLEFYSSDMNLFPESYDDNFFVASAGRLPGIVRFAYDLKNREAVTPPQYFMSYLRAKQNNYSGMVTALSFGPDGLYFALLVSTTGSSVPIYKIIYDPKSQHPYRPDDVSDPKVLLNTLQCLACHSLNGDGGNIAPTLDYIDLVPRLEQRLNSQEYLEAVILVNSLDSEPFTSFSQARQDILDRSGKTKILTWIYYHLLEPKFDNPNAQMPNLGLSKNQAQVIAEYLVTGPKINREIIKDDNTQTESPVKTLESAETQSVSAFENLLQNLPTLRYRHLPFIFLGGVFATWLVIQWLQRKKLD